VEQEVKGFVTRLVITALGLWAAATIVPGIGFSGWKSLAVAALLLGIVNAIVRPVLIILTLPITLLTLGFFLLVVNGISLGIVAWLVPGFHIAGLISATLGAVVVGLTGWLANSFVGGSGRIEHIRRVEVSGRRVDG
jgi:putative membrane protein